MHNPEATFYNSCPICGSRRLRPSPRYSAVHLVRCLECGMRFAERRPSDEELQAHYAKYGTAWFDSPVTRLRYRELLRSFECYRKTNRILDVGCGPGYFLEEAVRQGWSACGTEFGARALELNRARGFDVLPAPLTIDRLKPRSFDVITAFEVVEHVRDPGNEAAVIAHALRLGGLFYCTTPNFDAATRRLLQSKWVTIGYPEHLLYYTRATLERWLAPFGFVPTSIRTTGFSPTALRASLAPTADRPAPGHSGDERLRLVSEQSHALRLIKSTINGALSAVSAGDTLKASFERR